MSIFRTILKFLAGLVGGKLQLLLITGGILAFGWWHLHATAVAYSEGAKAGRQSTLKDQAKEIDRKIGGILAQAALERAELDAQRTALDSERTRLSAQRREINSALTAGISQLATRDAVLRNEISNTPDADVLVRYRLALSRARTAEAARAQP
jgi:phosphoglycerate-specific signal transduction histidine kinase